MDFYKSMDDLEKYFIDFIKKVPSFGKSFICLDDPVNNKIIKRLRQESINALGLEWYQNWNRNLPSWEYTPGNINIPVLLWLSNLIDWLDMEGFARARYQLLGNGSHWFPGCNANLLDVDISEGQLLKVLEGHINPKKVMRKLRTLKEKFGDKNAKRLSRK